MENKSSDIISVKESPLASIVKNHMKEIDNAYLTDKIESPEKVELKEVLDQNIQEVASNDADNVSISYRKNVCKFRDVQRGPVKNCPDVHVLPEILKLQFCTGYIRHPSLCQKKTCLPTSTRPS